MIRRAEEGHSGRRHTVAGGLAALLLASGLAAQSGPSFSFDPDDQPHLAAGMDSINTYSGQLALTVPIGPVYEAAPGLSFQIQLHYSSRVWGPGTWALWGFGPYVAEPYMVLQGDPALGLGWSFSLGKIVETSAGVPAAYIGPDGSAHRLYNRRVFCASGCPALDGFFYTRDGSYLRVKYVSSASGYQMWSSNGSLITLGKQIGPPATASFDDPPTNYQNDYGRGRNGWYVTAMANAYNVAGHAITVSYQPSSSVPWVPYQITIPSLGGGSPRVLQVNMSGNLIGSFTVPTFNGVSATYTLTHHQHGTVQRPITHPASPFPLPTDPTPYFLDDISLPIGGYSYSFDYYFGSVRYAKGALESQTIPTGATITYDYGTWSFYHANPLNRPGPPIVACQYPPPSGFSGPTLRTGPGLEPTLPPIGDCASPDRAAGVVERTVSYTTLSSPATSVTKYYQIDYPTAASGVGTETQTLMLSPPDDTGKMHTNAFLFTGSNPDWINGPLVGSLEREAVFAGDQTSGPPDTSSAERVWRFTYAADAVDPNPTSATSEAFEGNRRLLQSVVIFSGIASTSPPSGRYHTIDYVFDANAGHYSKLTHSGTVGGDSRVLQTDWAPLTDANRWNLDAQSGAHLKASASASDFWSLSNTLDGEGYPTLSTATDGVGGYGTLAHGTPRDGDGIPTSDSLSHGGVTYSQTISFQAGSLKTAQWSGVSWFAANNHIDSSTGLVSMSTDPSGLSTSMTYDVFGRPLSMTPPGGDAATNSTYGSPTQTTVRTADSLGKEYSWTQSTTDSLGRPIKVQVHMPGGNTSKRITRYDRQGNVVFASELVSDSLSDSSVPGTAFLNFNDFGQPTSLVGADGKTTSIDYSDTSSYPNSVWFKTVTVNGVGGGNAVTKYTYDAFGNLVKVTESPDGSTNWDTTYSYNPQNRLIGATQGSQSRSWTYDAFGFLRSETTPERQNQSVSLTSYDGLGNVRTLTEPGSLTITRNYDSAGRLTRVLANSVPYLTNCYDGAGSCADGNPNFSGGSYPAGKLTRRIGFNPAATPAVSVTEDFDFSDRVGRLSSKTTTVSGGALPPQTQSWIYDLGGEIAQFSHPRSSGLFMVETSYDHGHPDAVYGNGLPVVVSASYQPSGLLGSYVTGNNSGHNVTTTIGSDPNSMPRPASFTTSGASQDFSSGGYSYDGAGNITAIGSDTFGYDRLSRLTSALYSGLGTQGFSYDRFGNLSATTGPNPRTYSIDTSSNRLTASGVDPVGYDTRGNVDHVGSGAPPKEKYTWDALDRSIRYQTVGGADWSYIYSGASERILKTPSAGGPAGYDWTFRDEIGRIATEYVGPNVSRDNVYLGNLLVGSYASCASNGPPGWTYYSSDHLGTPRLVTDASANKVDLRKYWPYGDEVSGSSISAQALRFGEMERDTEGNRYYDHARSHDFQSIGRFLSVDLGGSRPSRPQSWNRYAYVLGNPVNYLDPSGLEVEDIGSTVSVNGEPFHFTVLAGNPEDFWGTSARTESVSPSGLGTVLTGIPAEESSVQFGAFWEFDIVPSGSVGTSWTWSREWHAMELAWPFGEQAMSTEERARLIFTQAARLIPFREPDYYKVNVNLFGARSLGLGFEASLDRFGKFHGEFPSPGADASWEPLSLFGSVSFNAGWLDQRSDPTERQMNRFFENGSITVGGGYVLGAAETWSPKTGMWATEFGFTTPGFGVSTTKGSER